MHFLNSNFFNYELGLSKTFISIPSLTLGMIELFHRCLILIFCGLPRTCGQTLPLPFALLASSLLLVCEIYVLLPLLRSHSDPQLARSSRYHGDMFFRFLTTQSQEEDEERIRRSDIMLVS